MGSGKSTLGRQLAALLDRPFYDLDQLIAEALGQSVASYIEERGELRFRQQEHRILLDLAARFHEAPVIALGGGTPVFYDHMTWLNEHTTTVYLEVSIAELAKRLQGSVDRPLIKNAEDLNEFIAKHLFERAPFYLQAKKRVRSDQASAELLANVLME